MEIQIEIYLCPPYSMSFFCAHKQLESIRVDSGTEGRDEEGLFSWLVQWRRPPQSRPQLAVIY